MSDNLLLDWLQEDEQLTTILNRIDATGKPPNDRARDAFFELCELYRLPKFPDSFSEADYASYDEEDIEPRSVYEEIGIIRYLEGKTDDLCGYVLAAICNIKERNHIDIDRCAAKHFRGRKNIPNEYMIYYSGDDVYSKLCFIGKKSWTDTGAKYASKIIR